MRAPKNRKRKISLVLGSGGARGYAHIGVIEELEDRGYEIVCISGASMGALIGGLHACGKLREYKEWVLGLDALDVAALLDFSWNEPGMINGKKVMEKLRKIIGKQSIEKLPIPYTAVATDLARGREVWFQRGDLLEAIRASIAIPSFFTPVEREGRLLVDGGVLNPLPVAPTMACHSDWTLAVSLFGEGEVPSVKMPQNEKEKESRLDQLAREILDRARDWFENEEATRSYHLFDIMQASLEIMQRSLASYRSGGYPPDRTIEIPSAVCKALDFHKAWEVIETGRILAREVLDRFENANEEKR